MIYHPHGSGLQRFGKKACARLSGPAMVKLVLFSVWTAFAVTASAGERVALVIGNGKYAHGAALENPANDARAIKASLDRLGFKTTLGVDLTHEAMEKAVVEFGRSSKGADAALFFFAGHGIELDGVNYLVPVDADVEEPYQVKHKTLSLTLLLEGLEQAEAKVRIAVLDCCRDNPLGRGWARSAGKGLAAPASVPDGTMLVFAASPGKVAMDGEGKHSPFTEALLKHMPEPGLDLEDVFKRVGRSVLEVTGGKQRPWINSSYYGDFGFQPGARSPAEAPGQPAPTRPGEDDLRDEVARQLAELKREREILAEERRRLQSTGEADGGDAGAPPAKPTEANARRKQEIDAMIPKPPDYITKGYLVLKDGTFIETEWLPLHTLVVWSDPDVLYMITVSDKRAVTLKPDQIAAVSAPYESANIEFPNNYPASFHRPPKGESFISCKIPEKNPKGR